LSKDNSTLPIEPDLDLLPYSITPRKKDVIAHYTVDMSDVFIIKNGEYVILEPEISDDVVPIYENLYKNCFYIFQKNTKLAKQDKRPLAQLTKSDQIFHNKIKS